MHDVGDLHGIPGLAEVGEIEHKPRRANDQAKACEPTPEPDFLARIEAVGRHVFVGEKAAEFAHPDEVIHTREVVLDEGEKQHQRTKDKQGADKIVQAFGQLRQPREQSMADQGQQHMLAKQDDQA